MSTRNLRWIACGMFPIALWGLCACGGNSSTQTSHVPSLHFSASATSINTGQSISLSWQASNATSVVITATEGTSTTTVTNSSQATGRVTVSPAQTTTYQASATGSGGTSPAQTVTVNVAQSGPQPQITQFSANPAIVNSAQSTTLSWATANATSITITPAIPMPEDSGPLPTSGSDSVPVSTTTVFTLTATGPGGTTAPRNVTVTVPFALSLSASPPTITARQSATLSWQVSNGTPSSLSLTDAAGNAVCNPCSLPTGSATVTPTSTTIYTATAAVNATTSIQQSTTVTVSAPSSGVIKHIFFMLQENRSFDMYFGELGAYRPGRLAQFGITDTQTIDSFDPTVTLTNHNTGATVQAFHQTTVCTDMPEANWHASHHDVSLVGGDGAWPTTTTFTNSSFAMQGFLDTAPQNPSDPNGGLIMGYYNQQDLPFYYDAATFFPTSDSWHSPVLTNTVPNRMYLMAATSFGHELPDSTGHPAYSAQTIFRAMNAANISWLYYYKSGVFLANFADFQNPAISSRVFPVSDLLNRLAGTCSGAPCDPDQALPQVIFIDNAAGSDEHPFYSESIQLGAAYVESIVSALMNSDAWKDSVFILSYDEGGGFYDHVPAFMVPPPDSYGPGQCPDPNNGTQGYCEKSATGGTFNLTGFRVPVIVVSPYGKPNFVSHIPRDYTAILAFIEETFNVPALTARDAYWQDPSRDMSEFFDFNATPPPLLNPPNGQPWTKVLNTQTMTGVCDHTKESGP